MDDIRLKKCRSKLIETAKARSKITYGVLAAHIGANNQALTPFLNAIYREEIAANRPDLTLVAVYAATNFGKYNSRGGAPQSVRVDPQNPEDVRIYNEQLAKVYECWEAIVS